MLTSSSHEIDLATQFIVKIYDFSTKIIDLKNKYILLSWCQKLCKAHECIYSKYNLSNDKIDNLLAGFESCVLNNEDLRLRA